MGGTAERLGGSLHRGNKLFESDGSDELEALGGDRSDDAGNGAAVEAGSDDADIAVHIDGIGALDHYRLGVEISQRLDQRLVGFFALVKHVRKALAAVGIGDAEQPIGADADSAASGFDAVAPQQLLRDESVGGAAGQQQIGGFPSLLKLGHGDDCLGNQGAGTRRMSG